MPSIGSLVAINGDTSTCRCNTASAPGFSVSPHNLWRGNRARSNSRTRRPARARMRAANEPAGPAPAIATSSAMGSPTHGLCALGWIGPAKHERAVLRAEAETVTQRGLRLRFAADVGNEIQIATRIGIGLVDGWRQIPAVQRECCRHHAGGAARALWVANHRLRGRSGNAFRQRSERDARAPRLDDVVQHGRRAVIVNVTNFLRRPPGLADRLRHAPHNLFAVRVHLDAMVGVARRRVTVDRRINVRAAGPRAILELECEHPCALTEHEPVAAAIERPRRFFAAIVVARRHGAHAREAEDHAGQHAAVGAAGQHHVTLPVPQHHRGVADRVGRAGAAGGKDVADAAQAERDRDLARHHAANADGDRIGRHLLAVVLEKVAVLPLTDVDAAATAADDHAGIGLGKPEAGVAPRFARGQHAKQRGSRIAFGIGVCLTRTGLAIEGDGGSHVHWRHRRRHATRIRRDVELGDRARAATTAPDGVPERLTPGSKGRDDANAGDGHALLSEKHEVLIISVVKRLFAWTGALLFLLSLLSFGLVYGWRLGVPAPDTGSTIRDATDNVLLFTIFAL